MTEAQNNNGNNSNEAIVSQSLSYEQLMAELDLKGNAQTQAQLNELAPQQNNRVDVEYAAFSGTTLGKSGTNQVKLFKREHFNWYDVNDQDKEGVITNIIVVGLRGFVLKAKDGFSLGEKTDNDGYTTICSTTKCTVGSYTYNNSRPSPYPLNKWMKEYGGNGANTQIKSMGFMGSRGQTCADCIAQGNNVKGVNAEGKPNMCGLRTGLLFAVTEVGKSSKKSSTGIEWVKITELKDEDETQMFDKPVILNIETSPAVSGSGGKNEVFVFGTGAVGLATASNGGARFIPDDVQLFFPYWKSLTSNNLVRAAVQGGSFPEHPQLPVYVLAQTEMYLPKIAANCTYAITCPAFRTSGHLSSPDVYQDWLTVLNTYINQYEEYVAEHNLTDKSYSLAEPLPFPNSSPLLTNGNSNSNGNGNGNAIAPFDPTVAPVFTYNGN